MGKDYQDGIILCGFEHPWKSINLVRIEADILLYFRVNWDLGVVLFWAGKLGALNLTLS